MRWLSGIPKTGHPVERRTFDPRFGLLAFLLPSVEMVAKDGFKPKLAVSANERR